MIVRQSYIDELKKFKDVPVVKILAGIRRSGKSTILEMYKKELIKNGITKDHIIERRYTSIDIEQGLHYEEMYHELKSQIKDDQRYYLLLDEVQEIEGWEKVVNSLLEGYSTDIYVTGSNSKLMASEISTYLTGRFVSIPVYTLSFQEYLDFRKDDTCSTLEKFNTYLRYGGFPLVADLQLGEETSYQIVEGIYQTVVANDIVRRHNITNVDLFHRIVKYAFDNVGKTFSASSISKYLKSEKRSVSIETIYNDLQWLEEAFVLYRAKRYDLQGKAILKTQEKFYLADTSLKYALLGYQPTSIAAMLENIVYFELKRRGFEVYVGKLGTKEIDFVGIRRDERIYVQVCRTMPQDSNREIANLLEIKDNYPKYIVTMDTLMTGNVEGIQILSMMDFLLGTY